eukprot:scaffold194831_cov24-Tisochrysis_lutea.AAC.2
MAEISEAVVVHWFTLTLRLDAGALRGSGEAGRSKYLSPHAKMSPWSFHRSMRFFLPAGGGEAKLEGSSTWNIVSPESKRSPRMPCTR